jgi:hypothetical protein
VTVKQKRQTPLSRAYRAAILKASAPDPTATPTVTHVQADQLATGYPLPALIPNPSPEMANWPVTGQVTRMSPGIGTGDDRDMRGHSDVFAAAAARVANSGVEDPSQQLGMAHQRLGDFSQHPMSPLPGRADWRGAPTNMGAIGGS